MRDAKRRNKRRDSRKVLCRLIIDNAVPTMALSFGAERRKLRRLVGAFPVPSERQKKKLKFVKIVVASASGLCKDALNNSGKDPQKESAT